MSTPSSRSVSLNDIGNRYLAALQHISDLMVLTWAGVRNVSEQSYEEAYRSIAGLPSSEYRFPLDTARAEAARWWFKNSLSEVLGISLVFLEDVRKVCGIITFNVAKAKNTGDLAALAAEVNSDSGPLDITTRLQHLKGRYGLTIPMEKEIMSMVNVHRCLVQTGGIVPKGATVGLNLQVVQPIPGDEVNPNLTSYEHLWKEGEKITLPREEHAAVFTTVSVFLTTTLAAVQEYAKTSGLVDESKSSA